MRRRKVISFVLAAALTAGMMAGAFGTKASASEIEDLRQKKESAQQEVNNLESELAEVVASLSQLEQDLIAKGEEIAQAQADLDAEKEKEERQKEAMALRIKYMYESGKQSIFVTMAASDDMADVLNKAEVASEISLYDRKMIEAYVETENQIADLKARLEEEQAQMVALQEQFREQQNNLNQMIAEKQQEVQDFDAQLQRAIAEEEERKRAAEEAARRAQEEAARRAQIVTASSSSTVRAQVSEEAFTPVEYNGDVGSTVVSAAFSQIGVPYVWGGTTPGVALDCSGLTQYCYRCAGVSIPRTSGEQLAGGTIVSDPQPGDICWTPGHVAIYIGNGQMIEAQQSGVPVKVSSVRVTYYVRY